MVQCTSFKIVIIFKIYIFKGLHIGSNSILLKMQISKNLTERPYKRINAMNKEKKNTKWQITVN